MNLANYLSIYAVRYIYIYIYIFLYVNTHLYLIIWFHSFQHNTIEAVLERGEKLDDLVEKSESLSGQSKAFYKTVRNTNI